MTSKYWALLLGAAMTTTLAGCDSSGNTRIASVGPRGPAGIQGVAGADGAQGPAGPAGPAGARGPAGPSGSNGGNGSNGGDGSNGGNGSDGGTGLNGLNGADALATGGLVGPGGVAGTGLLANTGDPGKTDSTTGGILVQTGQTVQGLADGAGGTATGVDKAVPGNTGIVTAAVDSAHDAGQALIDTGKGNGYLVDGVAQSPNELASVNASNSQVVGKGQGSQIGVSVGSDTQTQGQFLTAGVATGGQAATLDAPALQNGGLGGAVNGVTGGTTGGATGGTTGAGSLVQTVQDTTNSLLNGGAPLGGLGTAH